MVEVDFSDVNAAEVWFERQTPEVRSTMASRAALRVVANLGRYDGEGADRLVLTAFRCTLTSVVRGLGRTTVVEWLDMAARSAALSARSAHSAARSAALSAHSALSARSAAVWDSQRLDDDLNSERLWAGATVPDSLQTQHTTFLTDLSKKPDWDFFRSWYEQMWDGTFTDWDLATAVAKINDDVWDEGLAAVAKAIRGIEANRDSSPLDQEALKGHLRNVIKFPTVHHDFAVSTGMQIASAITAYKTEAPANALPNGFEQFEKLPRAFEKIAEALASNEDKDQRIADLQAEVNGLHAVIAGLRLELSEARDALIDSRLSAVEAAQTRTFGEKTTTFLTNVTLIGAIGMGMFSFFGVDDDELKYDALKEQLDALSQEMLQAQASNQTDPAP
ncbi:MAG: hypothetical protein ABJP79_06800 [Tateyamaria sp.]|uniref:hypothetical protein n=1 Tax=Tateyamaria sp. TaxID=1929288 RepID=UPI0032A074C3